MLKKDELKVVISERHDNMPEADAGWQQSVLQLSQWLPAVTAPPVPAVKSADEELVVAAGHSPELPAAAAVN